MTHEESSLQTKKSLCLALKELMKHKAFSKITVSEIVRECNVNRKTFYYHFDDVYDLLKWMLDQEAIDVIKNYNEHNAYEFALQFIINYVEENAYFLNSLYDSVSLDVIQHLFSQDFEIIGKQIINAAETEAGVEIPDDFKELLCNMYIESTCAIIVHGLRNPGKYDREKLIEYCKICIPPLLPTAIKAFGQSNLSSKKNNID